MGRADLTAYSHGPDVDLSAIHVPLIVAGRGRFAGAQAVPTGTVVQQTVGLIDIAPTLLDLAGLPAKMGTGRDLAELWTGDEGPAATYFAEAQHPHESVATDVWPNLPLERAAASGGHLYVHAPYRVPVDKRAAGVLYQVAAGQPEAEDADTSKVLRAELDAWDARAPAFRTTAMDPETSEALKALGYVGE